MMMIIIINNNNNTIYGQYDKYYGKPSTFSPILALLDISDACNTDINLPRFTCIYTFMHSIVLLGCMV